MTRTRESGYPSIQSGRPSSRAPSSRESDLEDREPEHGERIGSAHKQRDERDDEHGYGRYRHGYDEDGKDGYDDEDVLPSKQPNRDDRHDEEIDLDLDTDLDVMEVLDDDDLKQMEGPDA